MSIANVIHISGGKDSAATALLAIERQTEGMRFVFADTGHEHQQTYDYLDYLDHELKARAGRPLERIRADFTRKMAYRREHIQQRWEADGVPQERIDRAKALLHPTGIPMLDLCMLRGRFPSTKARFCTQELKVFPVQEQIIEPMLTTHDAVICWAGVRAQESPSRAKLPERDVECGAWEPEPIGGLIYRPILKWSADDVFEMHRKHGLLWNPLYEQGMSRVGCMPCIHARKGELTQIAERWPEYFTRLAEWEAIVGEVSKRGVSTFFAQDKTPGDDDDEMRSNALAVKAWATHGGQADFLIDQTSCSSVYGLCE